MLKRILYEQLFPQIKKYLLMEFGVIGEINIDQSSEMQKQLSQSIAKLIGDEEVVKKKEEQKLEPEI